MSILEKISDVLSRHAELDIVVEGHTDNVPIKSKEFKDNWDLSVIRATTVARILTRDYGLNPSQVTAAGKGEFQPKASNETAEGRALNRRTEIILAPRLDQVLRLITENSN
jgi:chemotaxis protein MotB